MAVGSPMTSLLLLGGGLLYLNVVASLIQEVEREGGASQPAIPHPHPPPTLPSSLSQNQTSNDEERIAPM